MTGHDAVDFAVTIAWRAQVYPDNMDKPYSLTEVGLKEMAVRWQDYATDEAARSELERRCIMSSALTGGGSG